MEDANVIRVISALVAGGMIFAVALIVRRLSR